MVSMKRAPFEAVALLILLIFSSYLYSASIHSVGIGMTIWVLDQRGLDD
jgi:hypothetical protein